jgi:hypothetical protein
LFGVPASGFAVAEVAALSVVDPLSNDVVDVMPTFSVATNVEFRGLGAGTGVCGATGVPNATHFVNCLAVAPGTHVFSGTGTDTQTGSYLSADLTAAVLAAYLGTGTLSFNVALNGLTENGAIPAGVTIPADTANLQPLLNGLQVTYDYSYTQTSNPEPATMALLATGFLGFGLLRKRLTKR